MPTLDYLTLVYLLRTGPASTPCLRVYPSELVPRHQFLFYCLLGWIPYRRSTLVRLHAALPTAPVEPPQKLVSRQAQYVL